MGHKHIVKAAIALLRGCLLVLSCANLDIWPLAWIAWAPVIWIALAMFGEYIPFSERLTFIKRWVPNVSNLARGTDVAVFPFEFRAGTVGIAPMICYEDISPSFGRRLATRGPNLLVNLTNDAWFGDTTEPWQHLAASVYRAVELRLDLVRAVNNGVSAVIDSTGRVRARTRVVDPVETPLQPDVLLERVAIQQAQTLYATLGEWFGGVCALATLLVIVRVPTRERGSPVTVS